MSTLTDPARELADLCTQLTKIGPNPNTERGDVFLARALRVSAWSAEFYQIIFIISVRINDLNTVTGPIFPCVIKRGRNVAPITAF